MAIDDKYACRNCAHYEGNCGHHFRNSLGHIKYDCPRESEYDGRFVCDGPACFEPNEEQIRLEREIKITELTQYSIDDLEEALSRLREKKMVAACIDCKFFKDKEFYADNAMNISAVAWGSCINAQRNITSTNPHTEVPSWCPLKGDEDG